MPLEWLFPSRPVELSWLTPCRRLLPSPLPPSDIGKAVQPSVGPKSAYRQEGKTKEREHLDDRIDPDGSLVGLRAESGLVETQSIVLYPAGPAGKRISNPPVRGFHVFVGFHQTVMQPFRCPRTSGIEWRMRDLTSFVDTQVSHC